MPTFPRLVGIFDLSSRDETPLEVVAGGVTGSLAGGAEGKPKENQMSSDRDRILVYGVVHAKEDLADKLQEMARWTFDSKDSRYLRLEYIAGQVSALQGRCRYLEKRLAELEPESVST